MFCKLSLALSAALLLLGSADDGLAQGMPGGGFGPPYFGSSGAGTSSVGTGGFGVGSFGSAFGRGGTSGSAFGTGGGGFGSSAFGGQGIGQDMYGIGQGGQAFIGRDSGDMQGLFNNIGRGANQFFQQLDRTLERSGRRGRRNRQTNAADDSARTSIHVQLRLAYDDVPMPRVTSGEIESRLETSFRSLDDPRFGAPEISVEDGVVTLRGTVPSENRRLVMEKLAALEPGVREVRNQMTVVPPEAMEEPGARIEE
jgi:hypothetical protein